MWLLALFSSLLRLLPYNKVTSVKGKVVECEGIVLLNGEMMKIIEDEEYKYLGILEMDEIKEEAMINRFKKEYLRRLRLILRSKVNGQNKFQVIDRWAVAVLRYGAGIVKWSNEELQSLDRKLRKVANSAWYLSS